MEGSTLLEEVPGALGLLLWQAMRDVTLWAMTPREERLGLFNPDAEPRRLAALLSIGSPALDIEAALRATAAMLTHPADVAPEAILTACQRISQWAEVEGAPATALAFAQAAAMAVPGSARAALRVGRLARQRGEYPRAEGWLQRSIVLARQARERETHAWAYSALAYVHFHRGNMPAAERHHLRALRIARRFSLISREAAALHDLFALSVETQRHEAAMDYARAAVAAYGPLHGKLPTLAHDVAVLWVEQGRFARALPVLRAAWPRMEAYQQLLGLSNLVRAAGGAGDRHVFDAAWRAASLRLDTNPRTEQLSTIALNLARGAAVLGDFERGTEMARRAQGYAAGMSEHKTAFEAETLLEAMSSEQRLEHVSVVIDPGVDAVADELAEELTAVLA